MFIDDQNGWTEILTRVKFKVARHLRNIILFEMKDYSQIKFLRSTYLLRDCCGISIIHVLATTGRGGAIAPQFLIFPKNLLAQYFVQ